IRLHSRTGDDPGARRAYQACADVLREELGVQPSRATREAYEVTRREAAESLPSSPAKPARWPLVGRQVEWSSLREVFQVSSSGTRLLLIAGEAGVGKTR